MRTAITRRTFSRSFAGGLLGPSLLDKGVAEARAGDEPSSAKVHALLAWIGYPPRSEAEAARLQPMVQETLRLLEVVRRFEVPFELEPAVVFRPERS